MAPRMGRSRKGSRAHLVVQTAEKTIGIALLTDANSTRGYAAAAYADFRVWPRAALAHIPNYCAGLPP